MLQKFSGEPHTWQRFWDVFERNIHKNKALEPIDKFDYLIGLLHGPAVTAFQGFEVTGANYEEAIGKLKRRFGRKNLIVQSHMEEFMKIQPFFSEKEVTRLRKFHDQIDVHVGALKALEVDYATDLCYRYIDDLIVFNNKTFLDYLSKRYIHPS